MKKRKDSVVLYLYKKDRALTSQKLKVLLMDLILINIGSHVVVDLNKIEYANLLELIHGLNVGIIPFTSCKQFNIVKSCLKNSMSLEKIEFYEPIEGYYKSYIDEMVKTLNSINDSWVMYDMLKLLFDRLSEAEKESSFDNGISSIKFRTNQGNIVEFNGCNRLVFEEENMYIVKKILNSIKEI